VLAGLSKLKCLYIPEDTSLMLKLKGASLGQAPALPASIRQGWKGLPRANTLAYYKK
jgi:hypothetical protein